MGTNHNVLSEVVMEGGSESTLTNALENANEYMAKKLKKGKKEKK